MSTRIGCFCLVLLAFWLASPHAQLGNSAHAAEPISGAVVFMYHRFGEGGIPSTNIRLEQFEQHLAELTSGAYNVVSLEAVVDAFEKGLQLPDRTVAITIDDAYLSTYTEAWPRFRQAGLPFTVFVSTEPVDRRIGGYMTWAQLRELAESGATIANHTVSHVGMSSASDAINQSELRQAQQRIRDEIGRAPNIFAYPFGEYSSRTIEIVKQAGFAAAFGQHSGVAHEQASRFELPRFALNETYGDIGRFRLVVNARPLPVSEITPAETLLDDNNNPPPFGFTVDQGIDGLERLNCFASNGPTTVERLAARRFEVRIDKAFAPGRGRFNCTLPMRNGRFRWFGIQFVIP